MNKTDLIDTVAAQANLTKIEVTKVIDATLEAISKSLHSGDAVKLPGFGAFEVTERAARTGRNPANGETIAIPASRQVRFKALKGLKDAVNA